MISGRVTTIDHPQGLATRHVPGGVQIGLKYVVLQPPQCKNMTATAPKETLTRTINVRVPEGVYQQLDLLAKATARTKSFVTLEALSSYLETQSWQVKDIEAGISDADQGDFATDAEVNAVFEKHGA